MGRNKRRLDTGPDPEFVDWPTLIEMYPSTTQSAGPDDGGRPDDGARHSDVDLVPLITEVMDRLRRRGNRVVAACDFEDQLPGWDQPRVPRIDDEDPRRRLRHRR